MVLDPTVTKDTDPNTKVYAFMRLPCNGAGVSYTCTSIAQEIDPATLAVSVFTPYAKAGAADNLRFVETLPMALRIIPYRYLLPIGTQLNERFFRAEIKKAVGERVIAHIWPDASLPLLRDLRERSVPIVREMVNCHRGTAKTILDAEYRRLGLFPGHHITDASVEAEREALEHFDYVFCSNPCAEQSLIDNGVQDLKIRSVSFGWDPARFQGNTRALPPADGVTFLFVGSICVRKGAHLLLRCWAKSGIRGRLFWSAKWSRRSQRYAPTSSGGKTSR